MWTACWLQQGESFDLDLVSFHESRCLIKEEKHLSERCCISLHPPPFYILTDIRLACDRSMWCKVNTYSGEVIHYKSFPLWRVKSFIHSLMRLVIQRARPDLTNVLCHSTLWHALDTLWRWGYCNSSPLSIKTSTRKLNFTLFCPRCPRWLGQFSSGIANFLSPNVCCCLAKPQTVKEWL